MSTLDDFREAYDFIINRVSVEHLKQEKYYPGINAKLREAGIAAEVIYTASGPVIQPKDIQSHAEADLAWLLQSTKDSKSYIYRTAAGVAVDAYIHDLRSGTKPSDAENDLMELDVLVANNSEAGEFLTPPGKVVAREIAALRQQVADLRRGRNDAVDTLKRERAQMNIISAELNKYHSDLRSLQNWTPPGEGAPVPELITEAGRAVLVRLIEASKLKAAEAANRQGPDLAAELKAKQDCLDKAIEDGNETRRMIYGIQNILKPASGEHTLGCVRRVKSERDDFAREIQQLKKELAGVVADRDNQIRRKRRCEEFKQKLQQEHVGRAAEIIEARENWRKLLDMLEKYGFERVFEASGQLAAIEQFVARLSSDEVSALEECFDMVRVMLIEHGEECRATPPMNALSEIEYLSRRKETLQTKVDKMQAVINAAYRYFLPGKHPMRPVVPYPNTSRLSRAEQIQLGRDLCKLFK